MEEEDEEKTATEEGIAGGTTRWRHELGQKERDGADWRRRIVEGERERQNGRKGREENKDRK